MMDCKLVKYLDFKLNCQDFENYQKECLVSMTSGTF